MREHQPDEWADAVDFDRQLRLRDAAGVATRTVTGKLRKRSAARSTCTGRWSRSPW
jgi:hypothetical protein